MLGFVGFALLLTLGTFLPLGSFIPDGEMKLLQKQDRIEIMILSRGFVSGNPHYVPQNVTAKQGSIVEWRNGDLVHHTVTNDEGIQGKLEGQIFDSGPIPPRSEFVLDTSRFLDDVYTYHCKIHPWARGMITVVTEPISVRTDKKIYYSGERITVSGIASIPAPPFDSETLPEVLANMTVIKSVKLQVFTSENMEFLSKEVPTFRGGKYSYTFTVQEPGSYMIRATAEGFSASTTFEVLETPKEKAKIVKMEFKDSNGNVVGTGTLGQQISIHTEIQNLLQSDQEFVYFVQVRDSKQVTVFLEWRKGSIAPLGISTEQIEWKPENADRYNIEVFVWKSIASPEPLTDARKMTLVVSR